MVGVLSIFSIVIIKKIGIRRNQRRIRKHTRCYDLTKVVRSGNNQIACACDIAEIIKSPARRGAPVSC